MYSAQGTGGSPESRQYTRFASANPFAEDPYDVVGSIALQVGLIARLLSLARLQRIARGKAITRDSLRFIVRDNFVVVFAVMATCAVDWLAVLQQPMSPLSRAASRLILGGHC